MKPKGFLAVLGADIFKPLEQQPSPKPIDIQAMQAQSLVDRFLMAQYRMRDMPSHRLLAIECAIVAIDIFLENLNKEGNYDYQHYEKCRSHLIELRQGCV